MDPEYFGTASINNKNNKNEGDKRNEDIPNNESDLKNEDDPKN